MSLLDLNEDMLSDELLKFLCIKHTRSQYIGGDNVFVRYMKPCTDISYILKNPDKFALGRCWDSIKGFYAIKILPYTTPTIWEHQRTHGYFKDGYLLQESNKISNILDTL